MKYKNTLEKTEMLKYAQKHYFSLGIDDGAAKLCKSNFRFGLAKIHFAQNHLGLKPNATFISTPDETISRNKRRWNSGYGYGGKLIWGHKNDPLIFVDTKPNACGMLVGGLDELPKPDDILKKVKNIVSSEVYIDNIKVEWDYHKGNHFIDIMETDLDSYNSQKFPKYMFVIHGSAPELQQENDKGVGLYYDKSKNLMNICNSINTPFGEIKYLEGNNAKEYFEFFNFAKKFAADKRRKAAEMLFGNFKEISNPLHQGLLSYGELVLGAQHITSDEQKIFPIALRSDLPIYLMHGVKSLSEEQIDDLGFENRAKKFGILKNLKEFNVLPHGGGYDLPHINSVIEVLEIENEHYFVCEQEIQEGFTIFSDVAETSYIYRGKKIVNRTVNLELGNIVGKLFPKFVLKI
ncbi:hypothetical protein DSAG12_02238 [Promethearchaeum syntrophicum]|uniref:Uncharacterized protein n=1 Tax=Promethearchaeum syntrophicum TaxID=2594042 RepID=A0A5B9DB84_9ARCH|nr:hypothetical protein [Candidatus Prometheoarchaeum syntrophicum]QEE16408.1 hypothetical protein DSAG12_02238 [Candidatus Prometheoarchaeum syntrophicum]